VPQGAAVGPRGIAFDHPGDDADRCCFLGGDPGEIPQILLGFPNDLRIVVVLDFLVAGNDDGGFERPNFVKVGDPLCPLGFTGLGGHHVHLVVGKVPGDDRSQRRNKEDGGVRGVGPTDPDDPQLIAFQVDRVGGQDLRQHLRRAGRNLAGEDRLPVPGDGGVSRLGDNLSRRNALRFRKALDQPGQTEPVVPMAVGDVDAR